MLKNDGSERSVSELLASAESLLGLTRSLSECTTSERYFDFESQPFDGGAGGADVWRKQHAVVIIYNSININDRLYYYHL